LHDVLDPPQKENSRLYPDWYLVGSRLCALALYAGQAVTAAAS